ncbi:MAG: phosphoglycerate kinase [Salibacteraceae bacterium]
MPSIDSISFKGKKALIRVDFNVPLNDSLEVSDATRIVAAVPTINHVIENGGSVVLMSHLGRPKNGPEHKYSLQHIVSTLSEKLNKPVLFADNCVGDSAFEKSAGLAPGEVLLLENLRFHEDEQKGSTDFAQQLARHGDVYINDAFGTAHRAHASTTVVAKFMKEKCFGFLMNAEVANGNKVLKEAAHPYTAIIGGAKVSSKIEVITSLLPRIDHLIIGGGMAYTFIKALGGKIGASLVEDDFLDTAKAIMDNAEKQGKSILLPEDSVVADNFKNDANTKIVASDQIEDGWMGLDVGPKAIEQYRDVIHQSKTILWNGPLGVFEMDAFANGTKALGKMIGASSAYSLVGGGDSVAAVKKFGLSDKVSYVSTGGGALLELLEGKMLPGIAAIEE